MPLFWLARDFNYRLKLFNSTCRANKSKIMKGIYREILRPDHVVRVINRNDDGLSYEDGGKIVCTKRVRSFDQRFKKDEAATTAEILAEYKIPA